MHPYATRLQEYLVMHTFDCYLGITTIKSLQNEGFVRRVGNLLVFVLFFFHRSQG